jgi:hypothetical protein
MKLHHTLPLVALACLGASANAANITDWGALGPLPSVAIVGENTGPLGAVDDVYTFTLAADVSYVDAYAEEFEARSVGFVDANFSLFSGTFGSGTLVGSPFSFTNTPTETIFSGLAAGSYYFEITGTSTKPGIAYDFEAFGNSGSPPLTVPEPAGSALLVAGLGMLAFVSGRRRQR